MCLFFKGVLQPGVFERGGLKTGAAGNVFVVEDFQEFLFNNSKAI